MTEPQYVEIDATRTFTPASFGSGSLEYPLYVGNGAAWIPSKSYVQIGVQLLGTGATQPTMSQLMAFADNLGGNLFTNAYLRCAGSDISQITQGLPQASALCARVSNGHAWLKSLGGGSSLNLAKFSERNTLTANADATNIGLGEQNEMYRPTSAGNFITSQVSLTALTGVVAGTGTSFLLGMPSNLTGAPTGYPVISGDIIVINDIPYPIVTVTDGVTLTVANLPVADVANTSSWYIIRKDFVRCQQGGNTIYVNWRPPLGIWNHDEHLGSGQYRLLLNPNGFYKTACIETKNPDTIVAGTHWDVLVNSVKLYAYVENIPAGISAPLVQDLRFLEYEVQSKPWQQQLQFTVSPYTESLTFFIQDKDAGQNPLVPPSMFKCINNNDLKLKSIQVSYAGITKPQIPWQSNFYNSADQFQQRYLNSYEESGQDMPSIGCETYYDFLQRGPFYHFSFTRDMNFRANQVSVNTIFNDLPNGPTSGLTGSLPALVYCISHYRTVAQLTHAGGVIVQARMIGSA